GRGGMQRGLGRSPTFLVGTDRQRYNLQQLQRREQHLAEQLQKSKPLCFNATRSRRPTPLRRWVASGTRTRPWSLRCC
ncbi:unnamed protein product, partial [Prorocentrum cordatum]